jgi:hypothetical protein
MSHLHSAWRRCIETMPPAAALTGASLSALMLAPAARAVELLTVHELISHCEVMEAEPEGTDAQYCVRYIQGFIDGAVATDVRVMLNAEENDERAETFSERAKRTRAATRSERFRAAQLAGFCLGDPPNLREVVNAIVTDLTTLDAGDTAGSPARDAVYDSLRTHYPCDDS